MTVTMIAYYRELFNGSVREQVNALTCYALQADVAIAAIYRDEWGSSEGLRQALDDLAVGPAQGLLVDDIARLSPSFEGLRTAVCQLREIDARLFTPSGELDLVHGLLARVA